MLNPVELTSRASKKIQDLILEEKNEGIRGIRISILGGGCSGFQYNMDFQVDNESEEDIVFNQWGLQVFVDQYSGALLQGTVIDYINGLSGGFKFDSPNATRKCGCGSSFSVD